MLADLAEAFLLGKRVGGCSERTIAVYRFWLDRLLAQVGKDLAVLDPPAVTQFFARLRDRRVTASTVHQAYRSLKTFTRWLQATGTLARSPLVGLSIKTPATLPRCRLKMTFGRCWCAAHRRWRVSETAR